MPASTSRSVYLIETYWAIQAVARNSDFVYLHQPLVKGLGWRSPAERLSRPGIESGGHGGDLVGAVHAQIGSFREVLTQQSIGVLVGAALPRALRIAEEDLDAHIDLQSCMLSHLGLIPGERSAELFGQGDDGASARVAHGLSTMAQRAQARSSRAARHRDRQGAEDATAS